jgi:hypothetical protein
MSTEGVGHTHHPIYSDQPREWVLLATLYMDE